MQSLQRKRTKLNLTLSFELLEENKKNCSLKTNKIPFLFKISPSLYFSHQLLWEEIHSWKSLREKFPEPLEEDGKAAANPKVLFVLYLYICAQCSWNVSHTQYRAHPEVSSWWINCCIYCRIISLDVMKRFYQLLSQYRNSSSALWGDSRISCEMQVFVRCHNDNCGLKPQHTLPMKTVVNFPGFKNLLLFHGEITGSSVIFLYQWMPELIEVCQEGKMGVPLWNLLYSLQHQLWELSSLLFSFLKIFWAV